MTIIETQGARQIAGARSVEGDATSDESELEGKRVAALTPATVVMAVMGALGLILLVQLGDSRSRQLVATAKQSTPREAKAFGAGDFDRFPQ